MSEDTRSALMEKLEALLPELSEDGLAFLIRQAVVLKHNAEIETTERDLLQGSAQDAARGDGIDIEQIAADSFVITNGRSRVFFTRPELRSLAKIVHAAEDETVGRERLFRWFKRERSDFLNETGIGTHRDGKLGALFTLILTRYKAKA